MIFCYCETCSFVSNKV